ncbi:MAG: glutathione S-transferase [Myxococcota bacterium]|nr:glutathione S-transferase [Myxococcota bacterium]
MYPHIDSVPRGDRQMTAVISRPESYPSLTLVYAKMQALAEPARMLLSYAGVPYEDVYAWDYYGQGWRDGAKQATPFGQVPVLIVDGRVSIDQSGAIQRYLSKLTGTCPSDPLLAAQADALCDNAGELFVMSNPVANFFTGERFEAKVAAFEKSFGPRLKFFARSLAAFNDGPFFFGTAPMFCDFTIFHHFQIAQTLSAAVFDNHPSVQQFMTAMAELPGLAEYLANRPQLVDVGTAPVLMDNGRRIQPGFE